MLKNQTKHSSIWKLTFIIPIAGLLFMSAKIPFSESFNLDQITVDQSTATKQKITITKDYTDSDLNDLKTKLSKKGITIKFKGVKRNDDGEITDITIVASSKNSKVKFSTNDDMPIDPIVISYDKNNISIENGSEVTVVGNYSYNVVTGHNAKYKLKSPKTNRKVYVYKSTDSDDDESKIVIKHLGKGNTTKTIKKYTSGVVVLGEDDESIIDRDDLIEIILDHKNIHFDANVEFEDDAIIIKNSKAVVWSSDDEDSNIKIKTIGNNAHKTLILSATNKEPLIMINGEKASLDIFNELDDDAIETIEVLKGDSATEKYGEEAKDGVILIKTKKQ